MAVNNLSDLYLDKLKDLYSAEQQILKALAKMVMAATHRELQDAFEMHRQQTEIHVERLERIFEALGKSPRGKTCQGVKGIIEEGAELMRDGAESAALDAGLISGAQSVEHYEMAGYGAVRTWAMQLGYGDQAELLQQTLEEERRTDQLLTKLAEQSVNLDAEELQSDDGLADLPRRRAASKRTGGPRQSGPPAERR